jgi:hypothetical protein
MPLSQGAASLDVVTTTQTRLSKFRFTSGIQCHKKLWWEVHEQDALELEHDPATQLLLEQGGEVGALARSSAPGGVLIDFPHDEYVENVRATQQALAAGATRTYEHPAEPPVVVLHVCNTRAARFRSSRR